MKDHDFPIAIVSGRSYRRVLKVLAPLLVAGACAFGYAKIKPLLRSYSHRAMEKRQDEARARVKIGAELDELFEQQLDDDEHRVFFDVKIDTPAELSDYYTGDCSTGVQRAFDHVLGARAIELDAHHQSQSMSFVGRLERTGEVLRAQRSSMTFSAIKLTTRMAFAGKAVDAVVAPSSLKIVKYDHFPIVGDATTRDVTQATMETACEEVGLQMLEQLTDWKRPPAPPPPTPMERCNNGFDCAEAALAIQDTEPERALELYKRGCDDGDDLACADGTEFVRGRKHREGAESLGAALRARCTPRSPTVCLSLGAFMLVPGSRWDSHPSDYDTNASLDAFLTACDAGDDGGCFVVSRLLPKTGLAAAASLLESESHAPIRTRALGTVFAIKSAMLFRHTNSRSATAWVLHPPSQLPKGLVAIRFFKDQFPRDLTIPGDPDEIYAITADSAGAMSDRCESCSDDPGSSDPHEFTQCVCVLKPQRQPTSSPIE